MARRARIDLKLSTYLNIVCYVDADWGGDLDDRHSTSGGVVLVGKTPVSWYSRRQDVIALSTAETELYPITEGAKDLEMIKNLITELLPEETLAIPEIKCDNQAAAIAISESKGNRRKVRHVDPRHFFIKELVEQSKMKITYIATNLNKADGLTQDKTPPINTRSRIGFDLSIRGSTKVFDYLKYHVDKALLID